MTNKRGFTLIEVLVATTVFILAVSVALFATVGSNSMLQKADARSAIVEGSRSVTDTFKRALSDASYSAVTVVQSGSTNTGVLVKTYNKDMGQNLCQLIGRATEVTATDGATSYTLDASGKYIATWIFKLNDAGVCETTNMVAYMLFQNRLIDQNVEVANFQVALVTIKANSLGLIRYRLNLQTLDTRTGSTTESRRASIDIVTSIPVGLNQ